MTLITWSLKTKFLGVYWSPSKDMLHYESYNTLMTKKKPKFTKRGISSIVPALYDPTGLIQPYIVDGKIWCNVATCFSCFKCKSLYCGVDWNKIYQKTIL